MTSIETRQNREGGWWCSTTFNGMDYTSAGRTTAEARKSILEQLGIPESSVIWEPERYYSHPPTVNAPMVGYARYRIDHLK